MILMKKIILGASVFSLTLATSLTFAATSSQLTMVDVLQKLEKAGYQHIDEVSYSHGRYKVDAYSPQGKKIEFSIDQQSGKVPALKNTEQPKVTMLQAAQKVQAAGYTQIKEVELDDGYYDIDAYDVKGKKAKLKVDVMTGALTKR